MCGVQRNPLPLNKGTGFLTKCACCQCCEHLPEELEVSDVALNPSLAAWSAAHPSLGDSR